MSALANALNALKSVMLMQERIDAMRADMGRITDDLKVLTEKVGNINERVIRIETMIEMSRAGGASSPRIEG